MRSAALLTALLIVFAGSGAPPGGSPPTNTPPPTATDTPSPESTATPTPSRAATSTPSATPDSGEVTVTVGALPFDPDPVFDRVLALTGTDAEAPSVQVRRASGADAPPQASAFRLALGVEQPAEQQPPDGFTAPRNATAFVYEHVTDEPTAAESVLAHEFVHVVQLRNRWLLATGADLPRVDGHPTADAMRAGTMLIEGVATHYQGRYDRQFLSAKQPAPADQMATYRNASAHERLTLAPYALGPQYVSSRLEGGEDLSAIHENRPVSTEQVLHDTDDPIAPLNVSTADSGDWVVEGRDTQGELFLRVALRTELNRSAAVDAAHGWGNDRQVTYERGNATGTAWVLRWDDADNATEFETAFERYLEAKATPDDGVWRQDDGNATYRFQRLTNRTTVVYLGNESFVRAANATAETESRVAVKPRNETPA